ncbi:MAG: helix-turn-helix domain-containing protein [Melioribacteraceae bacterium]
MEISLRIKEYIDKNFDGNDSALAKSLGMSPQTLYQYTNGRSIPGGKILTKLAGLGCNINWLLLGEEGVSKVREQSVEYSTEFSGLNARIEKLEKEMQELKAHNYDLLKENERLMLSEAKMRGEVLQLNSISDKLEKNAKIKG